MAASLCAACGVELGILADSPNTVDTPQHEASAAISSDFLLGNTRAGLERIRLRLLDLTNRNKLLNFRHAPRSTIQIVNALTDDLFDRLTDGATLVFRYVPEPPVLPGGTKPSAKEEAQRLGIPTSLELPTPTAVPVPLSTLQNRLQTLHYPTDLEAILRRMAYSARTAIEESGTNMLYLAFGFLEWYESESSTEPRLAPLLLVPVTMARGKPDRASGTFTYEISYSGEDIESNLSLKEKLKRDFALELAEFSEDDTPEKYFTKLSGVLAAKSRWRLRRQVTLALLYFGKLLMYRDLDPKNWPPGADLTQNPRIKDLFEGTKQPEITLAQEYDIDAPDRKNVAPPLILDADSSQHSALIDALDGKNLVIEGPPGTGKSQTITNLIALALARGKTVLFVSEKLAALEVVRRRLDGAGLGIFCLELHSNKTTKQKLLDDLEVRLEAQGTFQAPKALSEKIVLLERTKQELGEYATLINAPFGPLGTTVFDIIWARERSRLELSFDHHILADIFLNRGENTSLADRESDCQALEIYAIHLSGILKSNNTITDHPWYGICTASLGYPEERTFLDNLRALRDSARDLARIVQGFRSFTSVSLAETRAETARLVTAVSKLPTNIAAGNPGRDLVQAAAKPAGRAAFGVFCDRHRAWRANRGALLNFFSHIPEGPVDVVDRLRSACHDAAREGLNGHTCAEVRHLADHPPSHLENIDPKLGVDVSEIARHVTSLESTRPLTRIFRSEYRKAKRAFRVLFGSAGRRPRAEMIQAFRSLHEFLLCALGGLAEPTNCLARPEKATVLGSRVLEIAASAKNITSVFTLHQVRDEIAPDALAQILDRLDAFYRQTAELEDHDIRNLIGPQFRGVNTNVSLLQEALATVEQIQNSGLPPEVEHWILTKNTLDRLNQIVNLIGPVNEALTRLDILDSTVQQAGQIIAAQWHQEGSPSLEAIATRIDRALDSSNSLRPWLDFQGAFRQIANLKLQSIAKLLAEQQIRPADAIPAYCYALYNSLVHEVFANTPRLLQFTGLTQEAIRERFVRYDKEIINLNRDWAACQIDKRPVPIGIQTGPVGQISELALITQEIKKKKRHIPTRQLIRRASSALQGLKPCFMMGPLSVAQYLPPGKLMFDILIMDEASQLKPEDALGAVARGAQLVVVGDPKQLPPTSFFDRKFDGEEDEDADDTLSVEEHESILDVASTLYQPIRQLRWHYRSRHESLIAFSNREFYRDRLLVFPSPLQAPPNLGVKFRHIGDGVYENRRNRPEAERVINAILNHVRNRPNESLGVVALNGEQRDLLDEILNERIRNDDIAQQALDIGAARGEPFFIKNLENVQGDERDVIMLSVTYGRDSRGNLFQRFGPINASQGHRRLNVLFTRARSRVLVFSSMDPDELRTDSSSSYGVRVLKSYLVYAKTGRMEGSRFTGMEPANDFEVAVAASLRERGFQTVAQVGVAGFFIDVAARHPKREGAFVLGIECDGASYHSARSARDRDRLRQSILENLGWNIHRIWSTDWFKNPQGEVARVISRIEKILTEIPQHDSLLQDAELDPEEALTASRKIPGALRKPINNGVLLDAVGALNHQNSRRAPKTST